jgi:hypothetical protein
MKTMTEKETSGILTLCEDFTALTGEHKRFALAVFQGLLQTQEDAGFDMKHDFLLMTDPQGWGIKGGIN